MKVIPMNSQQTLSLPRLCFTSFHAYKLFNPASRAQLGGSEAQMYALAQLFAARGYWVSFVVGDFGQPSKEKHDLINVMRSISTTKTIWNYITAPFILWYSWWQSQADVFVASPAGPEIGLLALFCFITGKKMIFRAASYVDTTQDKVKALGIISGTLYQFGLRSAHQIICQTKEAQQTLRSFHKRHCVIIPNIVEKIENSAIQRNGVLWIGSAREVKRPQLFLELAKQIPKVKFTMVLSRTGSPTMWKAIERECKHIPNINFVGEVDPQAVFTFLSNAKVLVGTSLYEGFPNVYLQAASSGTPIVSLAVNPDQFLNIYDVGLCAENDMKKFISYVEWLLDNEEEWQKKSQAAKRYIERFHTTKGIVHAWETVFKQVV